MTTQAASYGTAARPTGGVPSELRNRRFEDLFHSAGVCIAIAELDGRFVDANPACLDLLGYSLEEFCQRDIRTITHPDDRAYNRDQLQALLAGEIRAFTMEKRHLTKAGNVVSWPT